MEAQASEALEDLFHLSACPLQCECDSGLCPLQCECDSDLCPLQYDGDLGLCPLQCDHDLGLCLFKCDGDSGLLRLSLSILHLLFSAISLKALTKHTYEDSFYLEEKFLLQSLFQNQSWLGLPGYHP